MIVYIAAPYSSDPEKNTRDAIMIADVLVKQGYIPYIPHLNHFWHKISPKDYKFWLETGDDKYLIDKEDNLSGLAHAITNLIFLEWYRQKELSEKSDV